MDKIYGIRNKKTGELWADVFCLALFEGILEAVAWAKEQKISLEENEIVRAEYKILGKLEDKDLEKLALMESGKIVGN